MIKPKLKQIINYLSISYIALLFFSCKSDLDINRDHLVFRYNEYANINTLDPAFSRTLQDNSVCNQIFNGLVQLDDELNILPCIAKNWTVSEDGITYRFNLRNDVYFHNHKLFGKDSTRTVVANDFKYSLNRLRDEKIASPGSWVLNKVDDFSAINDTIFEIKLKQPFPAFIGLLTMKYCSVIPKEVADFYGADFRSHPIGTGPFKFKRWEENIKLVFRKNPNYFEKDKKGNKLPYLEAVSITFLPDKQSEFLQFAQGNIDYISGLDASYKDELLTASGKLQKRYSETVNMIRGPYLNTEYLGFYLDSETPEIQSVLLRQAINYGFDRKKMIVYLRNGIGNPANGGFIPIGLPGYDASIGYTYQPQKAKELVAQFINETGISNPQITLVTTSNYLSFCEFIQRELEKTGLNIQVDVMPEASLRSARSNGKVDMFRSSWIADYLDAENYLSIFYSKNFAPNGSNYFHYKDEKFDSLYNTAFTVTDIEKRKKIYTTMDSLAMQKALMVPLYYDEVIRFTRKNIKGLGVNPINLLELKHVKKDF
ncbi:ABC transporter substrate-binding protein [Tamlana sp. 2_MG-2023]|uniref:ABC transporter substrate-binding protein n=1 Tax=unclassified Tamlana TaxID=2614803 RepID=UPI0026E39130|nr:MULTISPECIES: ABC transporter substrate-binding protein [unclassified Tamlana]MDO6760065.1 ABC transporter substrate-binding protein [Tamlana sp. 2_MG-2023]MDO6790237.1 ABC transporter substrate-binding protein [Tamlana sp. 1_MG-2023]